MVSKITILFKLADIGTVAHWFFTQNKNKKQLLKHKLSELFYTHTKFTD